MGIGRRDLGGGAAAGVTANRPGRTGLLHGSPGREFPRVAGLGHKGLEFALLAPRVAVVAVAVGAAAAARGHSARRVGGRVLHRGNAFACLRLRRACWRHSGVGDAGAKKAAGGALLSSRKEKF